AQLVVLEGMLVAAIAAAQRGLSLCQSLLRAQLGQRVNVMILEKALTLELQHFEDSEFYDKLTRARREASTRPLSLVTRTFGLVQNGVSLASYGVLLARFSPWAVAVLLLAGLPAFVAEAKFSGDAFRLFRWRSPETRMQIYLETVIAREDHAKEVKLYGLGPRLLERYRDIFRRLYREDRSLTMRRDAWCTAGRWRARRGRELHLPGSRGGGPRARHTAPDPRRQSRPGGRERLGENHPDQVADTPVRTHLRKDPPRRAGPRGMGRQ